MSRTNKIAFRQMVLEAQLAIILVPLAWVVFVVGQTMTHGTISIVQLGMAGLCSMLVLSYSNWGRLFCGMYNILLVSSMYWHGFNAIEWPAVTFVTSLLFAGATIALFLPNTAALFREANTPADCQ